MTSSPRIEELRRRVEQDPASIAFAQLAEEYRRAGSFDEAVATCRTGLARHPGYASARVTLGRSLIEINQLDAAEVELNQVLKTAPGNLAALRGLGGIHRRRGNLGDALAFYRAALALAAHDPELEQAVEEISHGLKSASIDVTDELPFEDVASGPDARNEHEGFLGSVPPPALPQLERFLGAIHTYRQQRAV